MVFPKTPARATGASGSTLEGVIGVQELVSSMPSTWGKADRFDQTFHDKLRRIITDTMLSELDNVVRQSPSLENRGHVIGVAYMCALETITSYGYSRTEDFIREHFPETYKDHANRFQDEYRNRLVHDWNLAGKVALLPNDEPPTVKDDYFEVGLKNFAKAFETAVKDFLDKLGGNKELQKKAVQRYEAIRLSRTR